jgi:hypothetical protein
MSVQPLMPKATAVWLIENTTLTFEQVAGFCGMHPIEVQGIADGDVAIGITGVDPVMNGQLTREAIAACEADPSKVLEIRKDARKHLQAKPKGGKYTPVARRQDKPDAISWLLKYHPELSEATIVKLVGTTKNTIAAIRDKAHWNSTNIKPRDPVLLGLCSQTDLDNAVHRARVKQEKASA